ncbi:MAG TPA: DUF362 domain-containing protein [Anaerolineae bacterium]|jgi:uncharacterized protein (DUF362 family)|nr:DUF362 domain-containing protein [Anaerolineae bacterium]
MDEQKTSRVLVVKDNDKTVALQRVLEETDFFELLIQRHSESGKDKEDFLIAIKPNLMMAYSRDDPSTITDPELVEFLVETIVARGFKNVAIVESQNVFGNWFKNRDVLTVSTFFGYSGEGYRIVDLTEEMEPYDYGGRLGKHWVGPTWRDADFRISFAKNKTHVSSYSTLTIKNIYGCLPLQNKFKEYHKIREFDWPTVDSLKHFPCHYGLIDAYWSADGLMGLKADYSPRHTKTIIGGESIIAVEWVGAKKMGLDPHDSRIFQLATMAFGMPEVEWVGDKSTYEEWSNVPALIDKMMDVGEEYYTYANWLGFISSEMDPAFPPKIRYRSVLFVRGVMKHVLRLLSRYGL